MKTARVLVLIDWPNININMPGYNQPAEKFSLELGFERFQKWLKKVCGGDAEIIRGIVFLSARGIDEETVRFFDSQGFDTVVCALSERQKKFVVVPDPVDEKMIGFGLWALDHIAGLTHICIGSGDLDMARMVKPAKERGKKILILAGDQKSLSQSLANYADLNGCGSKMVHYFNPVKD